MANTVPAFRLEDLPHTPPNYEILGEDDKTILKGWTVDELAALLTWHGIGYQFEMPDARTKQPYFDLLKMIFYSRFGDTENVIMEATGKVDPGAIDRDIRQQHAIPDHYLTENAAYVLLQPAAHLRLEQVPRPKKAGRLIRRNAIPVNWSHSDPEHTDDRATTHPDFTLAVSFLTTINQSPAVTRAVHEYLNRTQAPITTINQSPEAPRATQSQWTQTRAAATSFTPSPHPTVFPTDIIHEPPSAELQKQVSDAVERALFKFVYKDLDLHLDVHPRQARTFKITADAEEVKDFIASIQLSHSGLRMKFKGNSYEFTDDGLVVKLSGFGPPWTNNSCFWDTIIVAASFLDAGLTRVDRANNGTTNWTSGLRIEQEAFLTMVGFEWFKLTTEESAGIRDGFIDIFAKAYNQRAENKERSLTYTKGRFRPVTEHWNDITENFAQFNFLTRSITQHCSCRGLPRNISAVKQTAYITPRFVPNREEHGAQVEDNNHIGAIIQRYFSQRSVLCNSCQKGRRMTYQSVQGSPPVRLVVQLDSRTRPLNHTGQFSIEYYGVGEDDMGDNIQPTTATATYRWLGGIYLRNRHFRVYWNANARGEKIRDGSVQVYDGQLPKGAEGAIITISRPIGNPDNCVPSAWMSTAPPILFYELVRVPNGEVLAAAQTCLENNALLHQEGSSVLQDHPWDSESLSLDLQRYCQHLENRGEIPRFWLSHGSEALRRRFQQRSNAVLRVLDASLQEDGTQETHDAESSRPAAAGPGESSQTPLNVDDDDQDSEAVRRKNLLFESGTADEPVSLDTPEKPRRKIPDLQEETVDKPITFASSFWDVREKVSRLVDEPVSPHSIPVIVRRKSSAIVKQSIALSEDEDDISPNGPQISNEPGLPPMLPEDSLLRFRTPLLVDLETQHEVDPTQQETDPNSLFIPEGEQPSDLKTSEEEEITALLNGDAVAIGEQKASGEQQASGEVDPEQSLKRTHDEAFHDEPDESEGSKKVLKE